MAKVIRDSDNDNALDSSAASSGAQALSFGTMPPPTDHDEISAIACISSAGVEVQFLAPQSDPNIEPTRTTVLISEGSAGKGNAQIVGTTGGAFGVAWLEKENGAAVIKLRGITSEGAPFGSEITLGANKLNNHSFSIDGLEFAANGKIDPAAVGINVIWVESVAGDSTGVGRILMERYRVEFDEGGKPVELVAASIKTQDGYGDAARPLLTAADADNDNTVWVGDEAGRGFGGAFGFDPAITCLQTGDILVSWIGQDNHVRGKLYSPQNDAALNPALPAEGSQTVSHDINSALADIGAAAPLEGDVRRLQAVELTPGNFAIMWIALASSGLQLNGQIFSATRHSADDSASTAGWVTSKISPIALPRDTSGEFSLSVTGGDNPELVITCAAADSTNGRLEILTLRIDSLAGQQGETSSMESPTDTVQGKGSTSDGLMETHLAAPPPNAADDRAAPDTHQATLHPKAAGESGTPTAIGSGFAVAATPDNETSPIIATTEKSLIIAWETSGSNPGTATISMKIYPSHGIAIDGDSASSTAIEVTRDADPDIAPAISGLGTGAVAVWIDASSHALTAQTFDENGRAFGPANGIAVGSVGSVSEIAVASLTLDPPVGSSRESETSAASQTQPDDQFAVVWVENADAHGYGNIMLQRYDVPYDGDGRGQSPVALGRDGRFDGNDAPEQLTVASDTGLLSAEGRGPQALGLKHGALALAWVECTSSGEQVRGEVIEPQGGEQILLIDLFTQLGGSSRIEPDTRPILTSTDGNDILVSWLQPDGAGGFDLTTARYVASGPDTWTPPEHAVQLQHFNSEPKDFSVVAVGEDDVSLVVTWWEDRSGSSSSGSGSGNHALGQRFDLMGNRIGDIFDLAGGKQRDADDMSDSVGLPDGRIVIVLTEENGTGDKDIVAYAFDTNDSGASAPMGLPETTLSGDMTTIGIDHASNGQGSDHLWDGAQSTVLAVPENDATSTGLSSEPDSSRADDWTTLQEGNNAVPEINNQGSSNTGSSSNAGPSSNTDPAAPGDLAVPLAISNTVITAVDPTDGITVDVLPDGASDHRIFAIDGVAVETPADLDGLAAPVRVTDGFVQLRGDGLIVFSPDVSFDGRATFDCAVTSASAGDATIIVTVNVALGDTNSGTDRGPAVENDTKQDDALPNYAQDDIFAFKKGYGNDAHVNDSHLIDLSSSGYVTFEALRDAGALTQVGDDVVITLNPADPPHSDKVTLKFASLQTLEATDFKFS